MKFRILKVIPTLDKIYQNRNIKFLFSLAFLMIQSALFSGKAISSELSTINNIEVASSQFIVSIHSGAEPGTGVIVGREKRGDGLTSRYYILTALHVVAQPDENGNFTIITSDNNQHKIDASTQIKYESEVTTFNDQSSKDLALIAFDSSTEYSLATIATNDSPKSENENFLFIAGCLYSKDTSNPRCNHTLIPGTSAEKEIAKLYTRNPSAVEGYQLAYTNFTISGMSGGAILDTQGRLIGIHGAVDGVGRPDGKNVQFGYSLGIPIQIFLKSFKKRNSAFQLIVEDSLPLKLTREDIGSIGKILISYLNSLNRQIEFSGDKKESLDWITYGNTAFKLGDFLTSRNAFCNAISRDPKDSNAWIGSGFSLVSTKEYLKARTAFKIGLDILISDRLKNSENAKGDDYSDFIQSMIDNLSKEILVQTEKDTTSIDRDICASSNSDKNIQRIIENGLPLKRSSKEDLLVRYPANVASKIVTSPVISPGISILSPTGFGFNWKESFIGTAFIDKVSYSSSEDLKSDFSIAAGFGIGDARKFLGLDVSATIFKMRDDPFNNGSLSFKVHRLLSNNLSVAVGLENAYVWGETKVEQSWYVAATQVFRMNNSKLGRPFKSVSVSLGLGNGRFLRDGELVPTGYFNGYSVGYKREKIGSLGIFSSVGIQIFEPVSIIGDWNGRGLSMGASFIPFKKVPLSITTAFTNIMGDSELKQNFIVGAGYIIRF